MLISNRKKFIFIHIYKTAGASMREALIHYAAPKYQRMFTKIIKFFNFSSFILDHQPLPAHAKAQTIIDFMGEEKFNNYFSFAFIRNPWDWQVSLYSYMRRKASHPQHNIVKNLESFEDYIHWRCEEDVHFQKDFIYSMDGKLLVNFIGRFEFIDRDFNEICKKIGISAVLPKINVSNTTPYQEFYNVETKQMIQKTFEPDISLFKYTFE